MWKLVVDREICTGEAVCTGEAPNTFMLDEEHKAIVINPTGDDEDSIYEAAFRCPPQAIFIIDDETGDRVYP